jgi:hypothetical protein
MLTLAVKPEWVCYKLDETIEQSCCDFLADTLDVCKSAHGTMSIRLSENNHDSWVTCTTSAECKTVITVMLTVMSGMDPHMISGNPGFGLVALSKWILLGCGSVRVRFRDAIEVRTLRRCCHLGMCRSLKSPSPTYHKRHHQKRNLSR